MLMLLNCGVGEDSWESLELQGDPTSQSKRKSVLNIHWKDWCWSWSSNTLAMWWEELTHWKRPRCWEWSKAGGEGDDRGWDGWMASLPWWTWVWVNSGSWWWTGRPGVLWFMGSQSRTQLSDWTELNWCWNSWYAFLARTAQKWLCALFGPSHQDVLNVDVFHYWWCSFWSLGWRDAFQVSPLRNYSFSLCNG